MVNNLFYTYKGAIHIHTKHSDGTGDMRCVCRAAKKSGLNFIIITDHNYYDTEEGFIDGVCVIKGQEISPNSVNHYLAFGVDRKIELSENPQEYVDRVRKLGGFGFSAHPDEGRITDSEGNITERKNSHHCIVWKDKSIKPDGVEIWNWFSNWADNLDDSSIFKLAYAYLFKHNIVTNPSKITLSWWDELNNDSENIVPALGGVDAHALKFYRYIVPVTVFPYRTCFETITNIISIREPLSSDFQTAKNQILSAVKNGQNTIVNRKIRNDIPQFYIANEDYIAGCGEKITLKKNTFLNVRTDEISDIKIIFNGKEIKSVTAKEYRIPINETGKYRVEIYHNKKGFAYSNPVLVQ